LDDLFISFSFPVRHVWVTLNRSTQTAQCVENYSAWLESTFVSCSEPAAVENKTRDKTESAAKEE